MRCRHTSLYDELKKATSAQPSSRENHRRDGSVGVGVHDCHRDSEITMTQTESIGHCFDQNSSDVLIGDNVFVSPIDLLIGENLVEYIRHHERVLDDHSIPYQIGNLELGPRADATELITAFVGTVRWIGYSRRGSLQVGLDFDCYPNRGAYPAYRHLERLLLPLDVQVGAGSPRLLYVDAANVSRVNVFRGIAGQPSDGTAEGVEDTRHLDENTGIGVAVFRLHDSGNSLTSSESSANQFSRATLMVFGELEHSLGLTHFVGDVDSFELELEVNEVRRLDTHHEPSWRTQTSPIDDEPCVYTDEDDERETVGIDIHNWFKALP